MKLLQAAKRANITMRLKLRDDNYIHILKQSIPMPRADAQVLFQEYGPLIDYSIENVSFFPFFKLTNEHAHFQKRNQKLAHSPPSHHLPQLTSSCCRYASYYDVIFWKLRKRANLRKKDTLQDSKEYWTIEFFSKFQQEQQK